MTDRRDKRLKRGLEDISPLFRRPASETAIASPARDAAFGVQFLSVCVADHEGDAFLANAYLASQLVQRTNLFASLVSVAPRFNLSPKSNGKPPCFEHLDSKILRLVLSHQELWTLIQNGSSGRDSLNETPRRVESNGSSLVFLDFEPHELRSLSRIAMLLDRVILFVQSEAESLREAYRLVKGFSHYNREIEFLLLFRGKERPRQVEEFLFERFSLITSRFLGVAPGWIGDLSFPERGERPVILPGERLGFNCDPLLGTEGLRRPLSPEKMRFWQRLQTMLQAQLVHERAS